ncbi:calcium homeostasis modulator protein 4-like [Lethenteron reissneri]|uniref:calcium homeostasis modulator protein 4-like n=1 Tax=Lethenteron reissneri TaxID=7753 RepID=UPI002AB6CDAE|nr:calcium homeostasis modulator protein 4-like [Lethenteron reissneri]
MIPFLVIASQLIFSKYVFQCPCVNRKCNASAGFCVLFVPALVLLIFSIFLQRITWHWASGLCSYTENESETPIVQTPEYQICRWATKCWNRCKIRRGQPNEDSPTNEDNIKSTQRLKCCFAFYIFGLALPSGCIWVISSLLEGVYMVCAFTTYIDINKYPRLLHLNMTKADMDMVLARMPCEAITLHPTINVLNETSNTVRKEVLYEITFISQMVGLGGFLLLAVLALAVTCCIRCCSKMSVRELKFRMRYREVERQLYKTKMEDYIKQVAEENVECVVNHKDKKTGLKKETWNGMSEFSEQLESCCCFKRSDYMSTMHRLAMGNDNAATAETSGGGTNDVRVHSF